MPRKECRTLYFNDCDKIPFQKCRTEYKNKCGYEKRCTTSYKKHCTKPKVMKYPDIQTDLVIKPNPAKNCLEILTLFHATYLSVVFEELMQECANCTFLSHVPAIVHTHNRKLHISIFSSTFAYLLHLLSWH